MHKTVRLQKTEHKKIQTVCRCALIVFVNSYFCVVASRSSSTEANKNCSDATRVMSHDKSKRRVHCVESFKLGK
jgi:hypothetical protein